MPNTEHRDLEAGPPEEAPAENKLRAEHTEALVRHIARRLYPRVISSPPPGSLIGSLMYANTQVEIASRTDPLFTQLQSRFLDEEPTLDRVFGQEENAAVAIGSSTGHRKNLRRDEVAVTIFRDAVSRPVGSVEEFEDRAAQCLKLLLTALSGKTLETNGFIAMSGVHLPGEATADFGSIDVTPMTDKDRDCIRKARSKGMPELERSPEINRWSVLVKHVVPLKLLTKRGNGARVYGERFEANLELNSIRSLFTKLSLALVLATSGDQRPRLDWEWRGVIDPVDGIWDTQRLLDLQFAPAEVGLTTEEYQEWALWHRTLESLPDSKLDVAMSRLVRAANEREDPADILVDSVIAWENMFGGKGGEVKFRITASMATIIAEQGAERRELQAHLAKIYDLRSKVVHGSLSVGIKERALCDDALELALRAFKAMLTEHAELLSLDSGERSMRLLLGGKVPE